MSQPQTLNPVVQEDTPQQVDTLGTGTLTRAMNASIETNILAPVSHNYSSATGGVTRFVLPAKGVLDAPNCSLVISARAADNEVKYPIYSGGQSLIERITCRVGGVILSQVIQANDYATMKNFHASIGYRNKVLDARHGSSNGMRQFIRQDVATANENMSALYNPELDQVDSWHEPVDTEGKTSQDNKQLRASKENTYDVVLRLGDLFPFFRDNKLPLFAMSQVELEIELRKGGLTEDSCVVPAEVGATPADGGVVTIDAADISMNVDYIHYDDEELMKIQNQVNSGGVRLNFTEVVLTKGINPQGIADADVTSNHIIGMAGKEVQGIYVKKLFDRNAIPSENTQLGHDNAQTLNLRSQQMRAEKYNFLINNERVYSSDVENVAEQHNYLSMIDGAFQPLPLTYDTMNYNANMMNVLLGKSITTDPTQSQKIMEGTCHYIGLNLKKFPELGAEFNNGTRISTAPIEFNYTRRCVTDNLSPVNLTFFIEFRRSLTITPLGVNVSDV